MDSVLIHKQEQLMVTKFWYHIHVFDPSMNMAAHVSKAVKSANYHLPNIRRIRKYLTAESTKGAVISLVTSIFDYCNGLLCGIPKELICKLQRVQNNAARVITLTKKHDHITLVLKELHWLPVREKIEFKTLLLAYKCLHGTTPSYLMELLKEYVPPRTLRSTSKNLLCEPRTNMNTYSDRSFSACTPKLWNQLICYKMNISINYVDINIYPLTMECNAPLSMLIWKGHNIKCNYYYYYYYYHCYYYFHYYHYHYHYYYYYYYYHYYYRYKKQILIILNMSCLL